MIKQSVKLVCFDQFRLHRHERFPVECFEVERRLDGKKLGDANRFLLPAVEP